MPDWSKLDWRNVVFGLAVSVGGPFLVSLWDSWTNDWTITPLEWQYTAKMVGATFAAWFIKSPFSPKQQESGPPPPPTSIGKLDDLRP